VERKTMLKEETTHNENYNTEKYYGGSGGSGEPPVEVKEIQRELNYLEIEANKLDNLVERLLSRLEPALLIRISELKEQADSYCPSTKLGQGIGCIKDKLTRLNEDIERALEDLQL
jgi:hypothetical protein